MIQYARILADFWPAAQNILLPYFVCRYISRSAYDFVYIFLNVSHYMLISAFTGVYRGKHLQSNKIPPGVAPL
jgi:hypothetical protein